MWVWVWGTCWVFFAFQLQNGYLRETIVAFDMFPALKWEKLICQAIIFKRSSRALQFTQIFFSDLIHRITKNRFSAFWLISSVESPSKGRRIASQKTWTAKAQVQIIWKPRKTFWDYNVHNSLLLNILLWRFSAKSLLGSNLFLLVQSCLYFI